MQKKRKWTSSDSLPKNVKKKHAPEEHLLSNNTKACVLYRLARPLLLFFFLRTISFDTAFLEFIKSLINTPYHFADFFFVMHVDCLPKNTSYFAWTFLGFSGEWHIIHYLVLYKILGPPHVVTLWLLVRLCSDHLYPLSMRVLILNSKQLTQF